MELQSPKTQGTSPEQPSNAAVVDSDEKPAKRTVLDFDDIAAMAPALAGHRKLVEWLMHVLYVDRVNAVHDKYFDEPGAPFVRNLLNDFNITLRIDGQDVLDNLPEGGFITVSNHPFGALDGITLIDIVASRRPDYKVMVNMVLGHIKAMQPNFITVDALASNDPAKQAVSRRGIMEAIKQVKSGHGLGFFPAGAVSKLNGRLRIEDREWQPSVIRLVEKLKVPVIPIYFHGHNSLFFNILGVISWQLRTLRLPTEVWRKCNTTLHVSVGQPISPDEQAKHSSSVEELGKFLKAKTYELRKNK